MATTERSLHVEYDLKRHSHHQYGTLSLSSQERVSQSAMRQFKLEHIRRHCMIPMTPDVDA